MAEDDILEKMTAAYNNMTKANRKISDYIFSNLSEVQYMSISSLSDECGVSIATITRFCRDMNCSGYNAFKLALAKAAGAAQRNDELPEAELLPGDSYSDFMKKLYSQHVEALVRTMDKLEEESVALAVRILEGAKRVFCFGQGGSMIAAMAAWSRFATVTNKFECIQDSHLQTMAAALSGPEDAILYFSYSGATHEVIDNLEIARRNHVRIILVTHFLNSPASPFADVVLLCGPIEDPRQSGSMYIKVSYMFIIDVLFHKYCAINPAGADRKREAASEAVSRKLL